jgi:hypothetical protein
MLDLGVDAHLQDILLILLELDAFLDALVLVLMDVLTSQAWTLGHDATLLLENSNAF